MKIFYNCENEGFYHEGVQAIIPESADEITQEQYDSFRNEQQKGFKIVKDGVGSFVPEKREVPIVELILVERSWRDTELLRADVELNKAEDSDPKAIGTVEDWRKYRRALRAWPDETTFPASTNRPLAPDTL